MTDAHLGRVLVASIHQAISEELPTRVDFYEHWLRGERVRDAGMSLAPMTAVLGFLRAEGPAYHAVMRTAGKYAADWTLEGMSGWRRRYLRALPRVLRQRAVLRLAAEAIRLGYPRSRVKVRVRRSRGTLEVQGSLFCRVRDARPEPLCDFNAALIAALLTAFGLGADVRIGSCAGSRGAQCEVVIDLMALPAVSEGGEIA